jgi:hypothetical protein
MRDYLENRFFHQLRSMSAMEMKDDPFLARGTPRERLQHGKRIAIEHRSGNTPKNSVYSVAASTKCADSKGDDQRPFMVPIRPRQGIGRNSYGDE